MVRAKWRLTQLLHPSALPVLLSIPIALVLDAPGDFLNRMALGVGFGLLFGQLLVIVGILTRGHYSPIALVAHGLLGLGGGIGALGALKQSSSMRELSGLLLAASFVALATKDKEATGE